MASGKFKRCAFKDIHNWHKVYSKYDINYSQPIIVYEDEYKKSKQLFSKYK